MPPARKGPLRLHLAVSPWNSGLPRIAQSGRGQNLSCSAVGEEDEPEMAFCTMFEIEVSDLDMALKHLVWARSGFFVS